MSEVYKRPSEDGANQEAHPEKRSLSDKKGKYRQRGENKPQYQTNHK